MKYTSAIYSVSPLTLYQHERLITEMGKSFDKEKSRHIEREEYRHEETMFVIPLRYDANPTPWATTLHPFPCSTINENAVMENNHKLSYTLDHLAEIAKDKEEWEDIWVNVEVPELPFMFLIKDRCEALGLIPFVFNSLGQPVRLDVK